MWFRTAADHNADMAARGRMLLLAPSLGQRTGGISVCVSSVSELEYRRMMKRQTLTQQEGCKLEKSQRVSEA
jgi:hypothetical protein